MLSFEIIKKQDHEGHCYKIIQGTYEDRSLGGPFRDFKLLKSNGELFIKLLRCYGEDASWCNKSNIQLTVALITDLSNEFPEMPIFVQTKMGTIRIPEGSDGFEIQDIIASYVLKYANL